jgi:hypothetical protein
MNIHSREGFDKSQSSSLIARDVNSFRHAGGSGLEIWYAAGSSNGTALSTATLVAGNDRGLPFVSPARGGTLDRLGFNVTTQIAASTTRIGLYKSISDSNIYPGTLIAESAAIDTSSLGVKTTTINVALDPGCFYCLIINSSHGPAVRGFAVAGVDIQMLGHANTFPTGPNMCLGLARAHAAFPSTYTAGATLGSSVPLPALYYRFSG